MTDKKNGIVKWLGLIITVLVIMAGVVTGWAYNNAKTAQNEKDVKKVNHELTRDIKPRIRNLEASSVRQETHYENIKETLARIEEKMP